MLEKKIKYTDFFGVEKEKCFYFHLSKPELIDLTKDKDDSWEDRLRRIVNTEDVNMIIEEFKKLIFISYGERSEDGDRFIKSEELSIGFTQHAAYEVLYLQLASDAKAASEFIVGIMPSDMQREVEKEFKEQAQRSVLPPPPVVQ